MKKNFFTILVLALVASPFLTSSIYAAQAPQEPNPLNVLLIGDSGVGKRTLIRRFVSEHNGYPFFINYLSSMFSSRSHPNKKGALEMGGVRQIGFGEYLFQLSLYEVHGIKSTALYYSLKDEPVIKNIDLILFCYDNQDTLDSLLRGWVHSVQFLFTQKKISHPPVFFCQTKEGINEEEQDKLDKKLKVNLDNFYKQIGIKSDYISFFKNYTLKVSKPLDEVFLELIDAFMFLKQFGLLPNDKYHFIKNSSSLGPKAADSRGSSFFIRDNKGLMALAMVAVVGGACAFFMLPKPSEREEEGEGLAC